jgi:parallel beta-helix repeat protein
MRRPFSNGLSARAARAVLGVAAWLVSAQLALAAEYFVSTSGNNAWPGTAAMPWATLQYAAEQVDDGDRVVVRPGDYTGFYLDASGSAAAPIEFFAEPGAQVTQRNGTTPDGINLEGASHVVIDGFAVTGMPRAGVRSVLGEFVTIRNVHAYDNDRWGIFTGFVDDLLIENNETSGSAIEHGIYVSNSGDRPVLRGNKSWGNRGSGIHMNGDVSQGGDGIISDALVTGNWIFGNAAYNGTTYGGGSGINMDGVQDSRIENNLLYDNHASGISLYSIDGAEGSTGNLVINNTIHQPAQSRWAVNIRDGSTDNTVRNNILLNDHSSRGAISVWDDSLEGFTSDYNALISRFTTDDSNSVQTLAQWRTATGNDLHSFVATAASLFVDAATRDYRLKPGAAAIDAGSSLGAPGVDFFDAARPQGAGVDMGAIEFAAAPPLAGADFDSSGVVDAADLAIWTTGFGTTTGAQRDDGDANNDGAVDGGDFLAWQRQLTGGGMQAVPEPTTNCVPLLAGIAVLRRRTGSMRSAPALSAIGGRTATRRRTPAAWPSILVRG